MESAAQVLRGQMSGSTIPADSSQQQSQESKGASAKSGNNRNMKVSTNIIDPAAFVDTLSILAIFIYVPEMLMLFVHGLFITSYFGTAGIPNRNARAIFGWYTNSFTSASGASVSSTSQGSWFYSKKGRTLPVLLKVLCIDLGLTITSLYLMPVFSNIVLTFAHAIVASSLSGGSKVFVNAIYSTTLIQALRIIWDRFRSESHFIDGASYSQHDHLLVPNIGGFHPSLPPTERHSFNTISSMYAMLRKVAFFLRRMDWMKELPLIFFQAVAIHVIAIGLLTYLQKIFPARSSDSTSKIIIDETDGNEYDTDKTSGLSTSYSSFRSTNRVSGPSLSAAGPSLSHTNSSVTLSSQTGSTTGFFSAMEEDPKRTIISVPENKSVENDADYGPLGLGGYSDLDFFLYTPVKKNKRLAVVRANQPLWSMLASSIVLAARQETSDASKEEEQEKLIAQKGVGHCYVRYVLESVIAFSMVDFNHITGYDLSVKVNDITWPQVTVERYDPSGDKKEADLQEKSDMSCSSGYLVVIYGLTPLTQYSIEIMGGVKDELFTCSKVNVSTAPARNTVASSLTPARPLSPVTILLDNLATLQMTLSEEKSRLKRSKKEHGKRLASLKAEIDMIHTKIDTADKGDERNKRKVLSLRESVRQLEDEIAQLEVHIKELEVQLHEFQHKFDEDEKAYENINARLKEIEEAESKTRAEKRGEYEELEAELNALISKRDKQITKKDRLLSDGEKFENEWMEALDDETEKRQEKREVKLAKRAKLQEEFADAISKMEKAVEDLNARTSKLLGFNGLT